MVLKIDAKTRSWEDSFSSCTVAEDLKYQLEQGIHWTRWNAESGVIREPGDFVIPRPVLFLGTLSEVRGCWEPRGQSGECELVSELALSLYHFPQTFIAFPSSFIQRVLHDFSMPSILLGIWDLKMNTGEFLLVRSLDIISNTDQKYPLPLDRSSSH